MFEHMTVGENLMLPSLEKISFWDYIRSSRNIRKMILEENHNLKDVKAEGLGINERIQMTLERWYIFNPMVLILFEPFALCDVNGVDIVKKYVKKFSNNGATVIIAVSYTHLDVYKRQGKAFKRRRSVPSVRLQRAS